MNLLLSTFLHLLLAATFVLPVAARPSPAQAPTDHLRRAAALMSEGNLGAAEKEARAALVQPSTQAVAYATLGTIRLQQKKLEESRQFLAKALELNPRLVGARMTLGQVHVRQGNAKLARQTFEEAMKLAPDNPQVRLSLAQLESMEGHYRASQELLAPITESLHRTPDGLVLLAINTLGLGEKETARELVEDWVALGEGVPVALVIEFAKPFVDHQLGAEAVRVLEKARGAGPASFELALALGGAYLASGDTHRASEFYEQAANLNDRCVPCLHQIARIAVQNGEKEKALSYLIKAKNLAPEDAEILFQFGRLCLEGDLFRDAIPALERAAQLRPENDRYSYVLASAYVGKSRHKEALALLDRLLKRHPEDPVLNYAVGSVLYTEGTDLDGAENHLRKSIQLQPKQLGAYYYLGMVLFQKGDEDQAEGIFRQLIERYPNHVPSLENLGMILVKHRKYDEAARALDKLLELDPQSPKGHYQYSLLLARLGKREESAQHMKISRELEDARRKESKMEFYLLNPH